MLPPSSLGGELSCSTQAGVQRSEKERKQDFSPKYIM